MLARSTLVVLAVSSAFAVPNPASAEAPKAKAAAQPTSVLGSVDASLLSFDDLQFAAAVKVYKGKKVISTLGYTAKYDGGGQVLIAFTTAGAIGTKVLIKSPTEMYRYDPESKSVSPASSAIGPLIADLWGESLGAKGRAALGFVVEEMQLARSLASTYSATLAGTEGSSTTLLLTPKEGVTAAYSRIELVIDSTKGGVTRANYYDGAGNHIRTHLRSDWKKVGGTRVPTTLTTTHHRSGLKTVVKRRGLKVGQGLSNELFSKRSLLP